jgi:hypothetical protein
MTTRRLTAGRIWSLPLCAALTAAGIAVSAGPATAIDGVVLINQARALAGGVTAGDGVGFPVTISAPGSYRLSSDLTVPNADTNAVSITADGVTLDLNGFSVAGPTVCTYSGGLSCGGTEGTGTGIVAATSRVTVRNGRVRGMGSDAIDLGALGRVEDVDVVSNGGAGITLGDAGVAHRNRVTLNLGAGIAAGDGASVSDNRVVRNNGAAISVAAGAVVTGNLAVSDDDGILATSDATIIGNWCTGDTAISVTSGGVIASNLVNATGGGDAVTVGDAVVVRHNLVYIDSGSSAAIEAGSGNSIIGNVVTATSSGSYGLVFTGSANGYIDNGLFGIGDYHDVSDNGSKLGKNFCCTGSPPTCDGSTWCPYGVE